MPKLELAISSHQTVCHIASVSPFFSLSLSPLLSSCFFLFLNIDRKYKVAISIYFTLGAKKFRPNKVCEVHSRERVDCARERFFRLFFFFFFFIACELARNRGKLAVPTARGCINIMQISGAAPCYIARTRETVTRSCRSVRRRDSYRRRKVSLLISTEICPTRVSPLSPRDSLHFAYAA